ncbi:hypothetical protein RclHR1_00920026 [Rhizophagus clarus]|uniref:Uncharacterized protein n=1 Tax=Rhizophagus clarus TaxID=94130 RepID=A0A2Z6S3C3_9GLOM|nr:hypothetical protein RclHR1_00920026 [Rhizophagus clarus]
MQIILANKITMMEPNAPNNCKCNGINERRKDRDVYVRDISPQRNNGGNNNERNGVQEQRINSNTESEKYSDIIMVSLEYCPNRERIIELQLLLGKLRRVGTFTGNARTEEKPKTPCHFVVPNVQYKGKIFSETMSHVSMGEKKDETQKDCKIPKNPFITVEMIANKLDRKHVAESLGRSVENRNPGLYVFGRN